MNAIGCQEERIVRSMYFSLPSRNGVAPSQMELTELLTLLFLPPAVFLPRWTAFNRITLC